MILFLNILLIAAILVISIAVWQAWRIIKKGKNEETPKETEVRKLERSLNVIHICIYILVVILVFRFYLGFVSR